MKIFGTENNEYVMHEIGTRIKELRVTISFSQKELADRAGISQRTVERIENGENVKIENLLNIMRAMNLLQNFEVLVPDQSIRPTELHDRGKQRKRVSGKRSKETLVSEWKWGDEE